MPHSNLEVTIPWAEEYSLSMCGVVWIWLDQRVSLRMWVAAINEFSRVEEAASWFDYLSEWNLLIERMQTVVFLVCFLKLGWGRPVWYGGGGAIPHNKYRSSTLVGIRRPEMALHAALRTGSIFDACDGLRQTGDTYSQRSNTEWYYRSYTCIAERLTDQAEQNVKVSKWGSTRYIP